MRSPNAPKECLVQENPQQCHAERSEASRQKETQFLHFVQDDKEGVHGVKTLSSVMQVHSEASRQKETQFLHFVQDDKEGVHGVKTLRSVMQVHSEASRQKETPVPSLRSG